MVDASLATAALVTALVSFNGAIASTLQTSLQGALSSSAPLIVPISPLDEVRACEAGRTALRAGAAGADLPFYPTGEGFGSGDASTSASGTAYETADGWRCEVEQIIRDGRLSLAFRLYAPAGAR